MKKHRLLIIISVVVALLLVTQAAPASAGKPPGPQARWTYMVYMNGDNNLERYVTTDIEKELAKVGSNTDVNVVVLADRILGYSNSGGDWTTTNVT